VVGTVQRVQLPPTALVLNRSSEEARRLQPDVRGFDSLSVLRPCRLTAQDTWFSTRGSGFKSLQGHQRLPLSSNGQDTGLRNLRWKFDSSWGHQISVLVNPDSSVRSSWFGSWRRCHAVTRGRDVSLIRMSVKDRFLPLRLRGDRPMAGRRPLKSRIRVDCARLRRARLRHLTPSTKVDSVQFRSSPSAATTRGSSNSRTLAFEA
jgi:hypothetical protein